MLRVCYRCEHLLTSPLVEGAAARCSGAVRDTSSLPQLLDMLCVVQLAACRPAPGCCADPSGPPASSLEEMENSCLEQRLHPPAAKLVLQHKGKTLLLLTGGVCVWEEGETVEGQMSMGFFQHQGLHQVVICGSTLLQVVCDWPRGSQQSLQWQERGSHCWGGRGRMQPMVGKVGGGIVNPDPALTAVEVRPPCIICKSRVQSAAGCA